MPLLTLTRARLLCLPAGRREATLRYAMLDLLKHPPAEFKEAIEAHFR